MGVVRKAILLTLIIGIAAGVELESRFGLRDHSIELGEPLVEEAATALEPVFASLDSQPGTIEADLRGRVVNIADGDTLTLLDGTTQHRIRLSEIDTPERGQDWSRRARQALADKVAGKTISVEVETTDRYGRKVGKIWLGDRDINREMVREGHAWVYRRYLRDRSLLRDEAAAKEAERGLWSLSDPIPPWEWRRGAR